MPIVLKSGSLNRLEPSGPPQACNGIALPSYVCANNFGDHELKLQQPVCKATLALLLDSDQET